MPLRRKFALTSVAALALAPLPAFAGDGAPKDVARQLSDPGNQIAVAVALTAMSEALLDTRVEPLRRALSAIDSERAAALPPDARLRDLAGPEAQKLPGEIGRAVPRTMGAASGMAGALQDMLPELQAAMDRMKNAIPGQAGQ